MYIILFLFITTILAGCYDEEQPLAVRNIVTTSTRFIPGEDRLRYHREPSVVFEYNGVVVHTLDVGECTLIGDYIESRVNMTKMVYSDSIRYETKDDKFDSEFISKYCY